MLMGENGQVLPEADFEESADHRDSEATAAPAPLKRSASQVVELIVVLIATVGALALGLGITSYLREHPYVFAYLVAYAGFRFADLMVRPVYDARVDRDYRWHRLGELPRLLLFAAAPFERTYLYRSEPPTWLSATGLFVELIGLWLALGGRIQLGRFATPHIALQHNHELLRTGFYRYVRHPIYAGTSLALLAWPLIYGAPIVAVAMIIVGLLAVERRIRIEEAMMLERFGEEYSSYVRETDRILPGVW